MLLTALWHQDLRKENHWNQHCVMPAPLHPLRWRQAMLPTCPEHESVIHRIQSIHYQQTIFYALRRDRE